jgi:plasmid stability protein
MKTMITRNLPEEIHLAVKVTAALSGESLNAAVIRMMRLGGIIGDARTAATNGMAYTLEPHRTDESQDNPDAWKWKLITYVNGEQSGTQILS